MTRKIIEIVLYCPTVDIAKAAVQINPINIERYIEQEPKDYVLRKILDIETKLNKNPYHETRSNMIRQEPIS